MNRIFNLLIVLALVSGMFVTAPTRQAAAQVQPEAPASVPDPGAPLAPAVLDCDAGSPFGGLLVLGGEREIFLGYRGGSAPNQGWLAYSRLDLDANGDLIPQGTWLGGTTYPNLTSVTGPAGAVADLNADGKLEYVQAYGDNASAYGAVAHTNGAVEDLYSDTNTNHNSFAAAGGNLTRTTEHDEEIAIASRNNVGALVVKMLNGNGSTGLYDLSLGLWRSDQNNRLNPELIDMATGDLDGDGYNDEIVVAFREEFDNYYQLVVLEYAQGIEGGGGSNYYSNITETATLRSQGYGSVLNNVQVATGDTDGDFKDEIILAFDRDNGDNNGLSDQVRVLTFDYVDVAPQGQPPAWQMQEGNNWLNDADFNFNLALAAGDVDGDGIEEPVVAYYNAGSEWVQSDGLTIYTLDAEQDQTFVHNYWQDGSGDLFKARNLDLDVADLDKNGYADIVPAFRNASDQLMALRLTDTFTPTYPLTTTVGIQLQSAWSDGAEGRTNASNISVRIADWDNDSLKAQYSAATGGSIKCKQVAEPNITSAIFVPPYWQNIQGDQYIFGSVGRSRSTEHTNETALSTSYSHSVSGYFGVGIDGEVASASAKLTAGYEYAAEETRTGSTSTGETIQQGWTNNLAFLVADTTTYNCYSYQLKQNGMDMDGAVRFCKYISLTNSSLSLDTWDNDYKNSPQYAPVARDWSSLSLFRGFTALQSSTDQGRTAAYAVDGNTSGLYTYTLTIDEANPWWQIDLGSSQDISKVRVWNRDKKSCPGQACAQELTDFHVFVSDVDFQTISNDPNVLKDDPAVKAYFHSGVGGPVTTFTTLDNTSNPIQGRYLRVQLADSGVLSLAEVQVFGPNHVEPDRYPVNLYDPDATTDNQGNYVAGSDGWFMVQLYDPNTGLYQWVRNRGNLLWNGVSQNVLNNNTIGAGGSLLTWAFSQDRDQSQSVSSSQSHTARVGAEFDVEAGLVTKIQFGGSYEYSRGFTSEEAQTIAWGEGFELDGGVSGFPISIDGQLVRWPAQCTYGMQPYYYEVIEESNAGFQHNVMVLDYVVPERFLDRGRGDLNDCYAGTYQVGENQAPLAGNPSIILYAGQASALIDVLSDASDPNGDSLIITAVGAPQHGAAVIESGQIRYTPAPGYAGSDTFTYTISDGELEASGTVSLTITSEPPPPAGSQLFLPMMQRGG